MESHVPSVAGASSADRAVQGAGPPRAGEAHCTGSWFPARDRAAGSRAPCASCGREVTITPPPPDPTHDPWWGARVNRFAPHRPGPGGGRAGGGDAEREED